MWTDEASGMYRSYLSIAEEGTSARAHLNENLAKKVVHISYKDYFAYNTNYLSISVTLSTTPSQHKVSLRMFLRVTYSFSICVSIYSYSPLSPFILVFLLSQRILYYVFEKCQGFLQNIFVKLIIFTNKQVLLTSCNYSRR